MAFDFPSAPTVGQAYNGYVWDGEKWASGTSQGAIYVSDSPPAAPVGSLWYESDTGLLYVRYNDGNSTQWVAVPAAGGTRASIYAAPMDALSYSGMQINGSFEVSQEKGTTVTTVSGYICDGWSLVTATAVGITCGINQGNPVSGLINLLYMSTTTAKPSLAASDLVFLEHKVEGYRASRLGWGGANARPITIGFWSAHTPAGTYSIAIHNRAGDRSYVTSYTQTASNVWEYKTVTIPGDIAGNWDGVNNTHYFQLVFAFASGSTYTAASPNTWVASGAPNAVAGQVNGLAATSNAFRITGVVIIPGIEAPSAERSPLIMRPFDQELLTCKRYWERVTSFHAWSCTGGTSTAVFSQFCAEKRSVPTTTLFSAGSPVNFTSQNYYPSIRGVIHSGTAPATGTCIIDYVLNNDARL